LPEWNPIRLPQYKYPSETEREEAFGKAKCIRNDRQEKGNMRKTPIKRFGEKLKLKSFVVGGNLAGA